MDDQPESDLVELTWPDVRQPDPIAVALLWSASGGAFGGGALLSAASLLMAAADISAGIMPDFDMVLATLVVSPLMIAAFSLIVVVPCTLLFGLPSALAVRHFALRKWPALIVCLLAAACAVLCAIWLISGGKWELAAILFTAPFALSAAIILWWRLAPPA